MRQYLTKATNVAKCGDTGVPLFGVSLCLCSTFVWMRLKCNRPSICTPASASWFANCTISQVRAVRSKTARRMNKNERTVSRAYGGTLSAGAVRERIMRAFIIPDVKALLEEKMRKRRR